MKRILTLIMTISFLLLSGCSSNIKIIENNEFKPEKIKLVLPDNQSLENHRWSEKIFFLICNLFGIKLILYSSILEYKKHCTE